MSDHEQSDHEESDHEQSDNEPIEGETEAEQEERVAQERKENILMQAKIRQHFLKGFSQEETFSRLCSPSNLPSNDQIAVYFQTINDHDCFSRSSNKEHCELVLKIKAEFGKLQTGIATWPSTNEKLGTFTFVDSRYALHLVLEDSGLKLFILDLYHGTEMREILLENVPDVPRPFGLSITWINPELLLICDQHWEREHNIFHLARLDFHQIKCTFLHSQQFDGPLWDIIFDKNDRRKIALWSIDNSMDFGNVYLAHIEDDSRLVINQNFIPMKDFIRFGRLDGDKLQFLLVDYETSEGQPINNKKQPFGECALMPGQVNPVFRKLFDVQTETDPVGPCTVKWFGNICSFIGGMYYNGKGLVYLLDLDAHQMTTDRAIFYGSSRDAHLENGNVLSIGAYDYDYGYLTIQRFTLNQPDTLANLAYFKIRREAIFKGSTLYEKLLPRLPAHLKPFAAYPSVQNVPVPSTSS